MQEAFATYLLNAAWQAPVVAVCALMVSRFAGLSPRARSGVWLTFLVLATVLPAIPLAALLPHARPTVALVQPGAPIAAPLASAADGLPAAAPALQLAPWSALAMTAFVAAVALVLVARLVVAGLAARRLVRQARPAVLPAEVADALEGLARAHRRAVPPVLRSADVPGPAVVGALRPVVLVPEGFAASDEDLRAALLHEMAHVLRHDYAVNLACEVLTLPVSWHPALLGIKAGVRRSRELACDAIAARAMNSQRAYARCLVSLARTLSAPTPQPRSGFAGAPVQSALAVGLFGRSDLEDRLMQLMKPRDLEGPFVRTARACGLAAVGAGVLGSAALLHVTPVFAQPTVEAPALAAKQAADQAQSDAAKPDPSPRSGAIVSRGTVVVTSRHGSPRHTHSWSGADGQSVTVIDDEPGDLSPEQQRQVEAAAAKAEARAAEAERRVNSPEFKARIAAAEAKAAEAEARINSPEFKARIANAEAKAAAAERRVNSPEFKAKIAMAQAHADAAEKMVNSPEFKAKIARAEAAAARAEAEARAAELDARATP